MHDGRSVNRFRAGIANGLVSVLIVAVGVSGCSQGQTELLAAQGRCGARNDGVDRSTQDATPDEKGRLFHTQPQYDNSSTSDALHLSYAIAVVTVVDRDLPVRVQGSPDVAVEHGRPSGDVRPGIHSDVRPITFAVDRVVKGTIGSCLKLDVPKGIGLYPTVMRVGERYVVLLFERLQNDNTLIASDLLPADGAGQVRLPLGDRRVQIDSWSSADLSAYEAEKPPARTIVTYPPTPPTPAPPPTPPETKPKKP